MSEGLKPLSSSLTASTSWRGDTPTKVVDCFSSNREHGAEGET